MMYEIYYEQTPHERYDTDMNVRVRQVLDDAGLEIVEEYGGSGIGTETDELVAEAGFIVDAQIDAVNAVSDRVKAIVGRDVRVTEVTV